jgi:hypothetical protein
MKYVDGAVVRVSVTELIGVVIVLVHLAAAHP